MSVFESSEHTEDLVTRPARATKRKFSVQEDEDRLQPKGDAFTFSRRTTPGDPEIEVSDGASRPASPERPVLGASR